MIDNHIASAKQYADENRDENKIALVCITGDLTHVGHIDYINKINERLASVLQEPYKLMVGVESDGTSILRKGKTPIYSEEERRTIFQALKGVDYCFISNSNQSGEYPETRPYATTLHINPDIFISHESYYEDSRDIMNTVIKLDGRKFICIGESDRKEEPLRSKHNRSTTSTIYSVIKQHGNNSLKK